MPARLPGRWILCFFMMDFCVLPESCSFKTASLSRFSSLELNTSLPLNGKAPGQGPAAVFCAGAAALKFSDAPADLGYSRTHRETQ